MHFFIQKTPIEFILKAASTTDFLFASTACLCSRERVKDGWSYPCFLNSVILPDNQLAELAYHYFFSGFLFHKGNAKTCLSLCPHAVSPSPVPYCYLHKDSNSSPNTGLGRYRWKQKGVFISLLFYARCPVWLLYLLLCVHFCYSYAPWSLGSGLTWLLAHSSPHWEVRALEANSFSPAPRTVYAYHSVC